MKKIIPFFILAITICGCSQKKATEVRTSYVRTLPTGLELTNLSDATVSASFSTDNFNWRGGNLTLTIYSEQLYDAVELHQLCEGDTILYNGVPMVVNEKQEEKGQISINGGIESGGVELWPNDGGTYRAITFDDHSVYVEEGEVTLPLSEDFTIIDCGEDPHEPSDTISKKQKLYLETLKDYRKNFTYLDTKVQIENGVITNITRTWIP